MKILHITSTYLPSVNGVAVSVSNTAQAQRNLGHSVVVLAPSVNGSKDEEIGVIRYPSLPNPLRTDYPIPLIPLNGQIIKVLSEEKFDVVHAHHPSYIAMFADIVSTLNNIPLIFTYHTRYDEYIKQNLNVLPKEFAEKIAYYTTKRALKKADVVVVPSEFMRSFLQKQKTDVVTKVIPTGIGNMTTTGVTKKKLLAKFDLDSTNKVLISVCRLAKEKNVQLIVKMMNYLPDEYHLLIVGDGPSKNDLLKLTHKQKVADRIVFVGKIPHGQVADYYNSADLYVCSSFTETQGLTLLEAFSFGLPVVAVSSPVNKEWINPDTGLISKNSPKTFAGCVVHIFDSGPKKYSKKVRKIAKENSIERSAQKIIEVYDNAIVKRKEKFSLRKEFQKNLEKSREYWDKFIKLINDY